MVGVQVVRPIQMFARHVLPAGLVPTTTCRMHDVLVRATVATGALVAVPANERHHAQPEGSVECVDLLNQHAVDHAKKGTTALSDPCRTRTSAVVLSLCTVLVDLVSQCQCHLDTIRRVGTVQLKILTTARVTE